MAEACPIDPAPSTSGTKQFKKDAKARTASSDEKRELESLTVRSLDAIVKITEMLRQGDTSGFINILEKVFSVVDGENSSNRNAKYAFIHDLLCNILEADLDELVAAKKHFDNVFLQTSLKIPLIDEADILRLGPIGEGNSSIILVGVLKSQDKKVALKRARAPKWNQVIEDEANVLSNLKHKNILKIFGRHQVHPEIVLEFMDLGNLVSAVECVNFTVANLFTLLEDVANAMEYVHEKKYLHRDLAARNVFLNRKKQCKIGDFGFAVYVGDCKDGIYHETVHDPDGNNLAPEALRSRQFTAANDVWGMGLLCWEAFFLVENSGMFLPSAMAKNAILDRFRLGNARLARPKLCPENFFNYFVNNLLSVDPKDRPSFTDIKAKLKDFTRNN